MGNKLPLVLGSIMLIICLLSIRTHHSAIPSFVNSAVEEEEEEEYENLMERYLQQFDQMKDPALGTIPNDRLIRANAATRDLQSFASARVSSLSWTERGPIYDTVGPSNGNGRGGYNYTSGMIPTFLVDTLNDPTGNTVFAGSPGGGLWKCSNLLSATAPNWHPVNDYMANLAIASVCQDPSNAAVMYMATGDGNTRDVRGYGIWKSTNAGTTWSILPSTTGFTTAYKILCDASGNVYVATGGLGLRRSTDGGSSWTSISPTGIVASNPSYVTDLELSSTGRLHATFGYLGTVVKHYYTDIPSTVTSASGWNLSTGIRLSATACTRLELASQGNTLYAVTSNGSYNIDSAYKSVDGGATWTKQNTTVYTTSLGNGQGYYNLTLQINPDNASEFIVGGIDAYRSTDAGQTITRLSYWVNSSPYVHADHHHMQWWKVGSESRIMIACDGGLFLSRDGGLTWKDRNQNLAIKQFYSCAIHPTAGSNYLLGGAQDNGTHQLKYAGLATSIETTGGDGCYVHINQQNPLIQFGSYVYNTYRRSTDGGATWSAQDASTTQGYFVNPFDYDDAQNILYASNALRSTPNNEIRRWTNANTSAASTSNVITLTTGLTKGGSNSNASAFKVSPYTSNRVFIGGSTGKLIRLDNANSVTTATEAANFTDLTGASFPTGYINCINTGTSDQYLVAVVSNYGVNNIWFSNDAGVSWTAIDGNLPDMPVWWAAFEPGTDNRMIIATETGVFTTQSINGSSTSWTANPAFPVVRTTMLKIRASDNTIVASTYGRGMFTATIPVSLVPEVNFTTPATSAKEESLSASSCRRYRDYTVNVSMVNPPTGDATVNYTVQAGNTATEGKEFDFTTNGDFISPSQQHVFTNGSTGVKTVTIRVYDDAEIESAESFTLGFTITGATNAVTGSNSPTHVLSISDNDAAPLASASVNATIGSGNTNLTQPFRGQYSDARTQMVFLASELTAAGITAGTINSFSLNVVGKNSTAPYNGFTVKMKNTSTATMTGGAFESGATTVYGPVNYSTVSGTNTFILSAPFTWDGTSNLMLEFCYDNATGTQTDNVAGTSGISRCQFDRVDGASGCSLTTANYQFTGGARPDVTFNTTGSGTTIATALNASRSEYAAGNTDQYFYTASGEILARIKNTTTHNYGCTDVSIDRSGSGAVAFWNNVSANYLMSKTFHVVPTTNNSSGEYEATFYFTQAEVLGWQAATGQNWNNIQMVKVSSQIKNYTPATPNYDGGEITIVTPTRGTFGNNYTLTCTFTNGFSGFGFGVVGTMLPVSLLTFQGQLDNQSALLKWATTAEMNSRNFEVEKSTDGLHYFTIGSLDAAGHSNTRRDYQFRDQQLATTNYYRLRMNDVDGHGTYSQVVLVRSSSAAQQLWVVTNPFRDHLDIRLAKPSVQATLELVHASGAIVARKRISNASGQVRWDLPAGIARGSYVLRAVVDGVVFSEKVVKG